MGLWEIQITRLIDQRDNLLMRSATQEGQAILNNQPEKFKRSASKSVSCDVPDFELSQLKAVHDLKGYGDVDEKIYRDLFVKGSYKLEIGIADQDGVVSKKFIICTVTMWIRPTSHGLLVGS